MNMLTVPAIALLLITCSVSADTMSNTASKTSGNQAIDPDGLFKSPGFHQVMVSHAGKTIYVAGQVAYDQDMTLIGVDSHREQTAQAFRNVARALRAAGAGPEDTVSSTLYIKGLGQEGIARAVMEGMSVALDGEPYPAHAFTMIGVETLASPEILIEITAVATTD